MYFDYKKIKDEETLELYKKTLLDRAIHGKEIAYKERTLLEHLALENHFLDMSSGTLRELVTLWISGADPFNPAPGQPAYDGIRDNMFIETKPSLGGKKAGAGHINDHTLLRHERFIADNLIMQSSSFINEQLAFIVEFPYRDIKEQMEMELNRSTKRCVAHFRFSHWVNSDVNLVYLNKKLVEQHRNTIPGGSFKNPGKTYLYQWLMDYENIEFKKKF